MTMVHEANNYVTWRNIFGKTHSRLKDQELILRFLALHYGHRTYNRPMAEFLNKFSGRNKNVQQKELEQMRELFRRCIDLFWQAIGKGVFRPERALNAAVFDSCMTGLAHRLASGNEPSNSAIESAYVNLLSDNEYMEVTSRSTADKVFVGKRLAKARAAFSDDDNV